MDLKEIATKRLAGQQIQNSAYRSAREVVAYMGAMQAQDFAMSKWAVGLRCSQTLEQVEAAMDKGEIIRTHLLRPTWHLVAAEDLHWILELTALQLLSSMSSRHRQLELDAKIINKSNDIIVNALADKEYLSREELVKKISDAGIAVDANRSSHLLFLAEQEALICSGRSIGNKTTYALLSRRVERKRTLTREEALAELTLRYFKSHGPATLQDFIWWSGLLITDAKKGFEMVKKDLDSVVNDEETYWFSEEHTLNEINPGLHLIPAFDEFIISYKDRRAVLSEKHQQKVISKNGIFWPVVVLDGQVAGLWKRTIKKDKVHVEVDFFKQVSKQVKKETEEKAREFGKFLSKQVSVAYKE
ncbi:winged helix DNA-binding domain-containing protein [Fulvivirga kasyanovii]|uniref:Winged helix DNA-binding domain-containing protein n=1 Tax=Fulvivirga kasyanovii TaxID=396812 RepID=A0ABW9RMQ0_9BACT|nr:winged helix DNA-binding domain-containing protein [Fulvivirga kasyanovii]MTI25221.1 winged helix DNA-binding domain-containing protein [Fulvivirga kasyanovii]